MCCKSNSSHPLWFDTTLVFLEYVCVCVCVYVAYSDDVYVIQNKCSQTLYSYLTHQIALHNASQRKKSSLTCRYVALPSMRRQFQNRILRRSQKHSYFQELLGMFLFLTVNGTGHCTSPEISTGYFILLNYMSAGYFVILGCYYVLDSSCEWTSCYWISSPEDIGRNTKTASKTEINK